MENKVDILCRRINEKYGLRNRQVGSLERYTDSCTNSIVQIGNNHGGHITLISGTEKQLIAYLNSILDGKMNFYPTSLRLV